ncbi:MAG: TIGR03960 family B12-binding radical SAM protein [Armatimonadetes bacterium]|nr:TIGR03960 family B12-binding radical SAM protein [Armatimonadota bacterium]
MEKKISEFDVLLAQVAKPARYTDGEWNAVHKDPASVRARFAFVYPDVYEVGMSHLGLHILYHVLNSHPEFLAERAYLPWLDMEERLRAASLPLTSLESRTPLREFDCLGITLPYELTYPGILNALDLSGIPLRAADRGPSDPLVIGGGPGAVNPEPVADFFDAILVGEAEQAIVDIAEALQRHTREDRLAALAEVSGVYVPSYYEASHAGPGPRGRVTSKNGAPAEIVRRYVEDLDAAPFPTQQIVPFLETVHSRATLEIMRGCTRGCRFCQAGAAYRPRRQRSVPTLLRQAEELIAATGYDEISLLAFTSVDYGQIRELAEELVSRFGERGIGIALPSLRADAFSVGLANTIQRVRKTGLTFAPEAGTSRLRRVIGKQMEEDELFAAAEAAFSSGWTRLKLYFMVGLPTETDEDVAAIGDLVHRLVRFGRGVLGSKQGRLQLAVSASNFVPKPHTPFQWMSQAPREDLTRRHAILQDSLRGRHIKLSWTDPGTSAVEAAISRGDRRISAALAAAWRVGVRFASWGDQFDFQQWERAFEESGLSITDYAQASLDFDEELPWDHIVCGPERAVLRREAEKSLAVEGG